MRLALCLLLFCASQAAATPRYVDNAATGANNGTSWANAWTSIASASGSGVVAGDTVYISGGTSGGAGKTYASFAPKSGSAGSPITYQIGQEAGHNGIVTFTAGVGDFLDGVPHDVIVSGDAGDGQKHFVASGYPMIVDATGANNWRISYVDFGTIAGGGTGQRAMRCDGSHGNEIDHCNILHNNNNINSDAVLYLLSDGAAAYDTGFKVHHNTLTTWSVSEGGPDIIKLEGNGNSVYNNLMGTFSKSLSGTPEHQDGIQDWTGTHQYIKIYNNVVYDPKNAGFVVSAFFGGYQHVRMYNNLIVFTDATASGNCQGGGVAINSDYQGSLPTPMTDCVVANNLICGGAQSWNLYNDGAASSTWTGSVHANNIAVNGASFRIDPAVITADNVSMNSTTAAAYFQTFIGTLSGTSNNFHLKSAASALINMGMNLTAYGITTDADGNARPSSGAWEIGPYEFGSLSTETATPSIGLISGSYFGTQNVTLLCSTPSSTIRYTTDGSTPTSSNGITYSSAIPVSASSTIKAYASAPGLADSPVASETYEIGTWVSVATWKNIVVPTQSSTFTWTFRASTSTTTADSLIGLSSFASSGFTDLSVIVRFNNTGTIDARNNTAYAAVNTFSYAAGTNYDFAVTVNMASSPKTYDLTVVPSSGGTPTTIASGYLFRDTQPNPSQISNMGISHPTTGTTTVSNMAFNQDIIAPTPNPMTFSTSPTAVDSFSVSMTASLATDAVSPPVEYFFWETTGHPGATASSWQSSRNYVDTGLSPSTTYSYYVWARDQNLNQTSPSSTFSVTTPAASGGGGVNCNTLNVTTLRIGP